MTLDRLASGYRPYLLLALLTFAVALPGIVTIPPLDRDEARFAVASRQMIESGDFVTVRFQDEIRAKKPPGAYWLQAGAAALSDAPDSIWAYRIPSVLGALVAVLAAFRFGGALVGRNAALAGAALLAVTPLLASEAHQAKTDALLLACAVIAQGALARFYLASRRNEAAPGWRTALAFWLAQAAAILVKGPIVPMIGLLTVAALAIADRRFPRPRAWLKGLRPLPGVAAVIVLVAPWAILVSMATHGQFIAQAVGHDLLLKLYDPPEAHEGWAGVYLLSATATLWPVSPFVLVGLVGAIRARAEPALRFCLAWVGPSWIVFEVVPTKLPHYVLPLVPALTLLAGAVVAGGGEPMGRAWAKAYAMLCAVIGAALAVGILAAPAFFGTGFPWSAIACALAAFATGAVPATLILRRRAGAATAAAVLGGALTWALLFAGVLPSLDALWVSQRVANSVPSGGPVAAAGFHEPSLVFLLGTNTQLTDGPGAAALLARVRGSVAVVEAAEEPAFEERLAAAGRDARQLAQVEGLNYSRGKPVTLTVWQGEDKP